MLKKESARRARQKRARAKIFGTAKKPRFSVFKSNRHMFLQLIDDAKGRTIASVSDIKSKKKGNKTDTGKNLGKELAELAKDKGIKEAVFDRGGYKYHGRIKAVAEGAREGGLKF